MASATNTQSITLLVAEEKIRRVLEYFVVGLAMKKKTRGPYSLWLCLNVGIGDLGIELVPITNQQWYCIGCQFQFYCLDDYALTYWKSWKHANSIPVWIPKSNELKLKFGLNITLSL
jgi:hypothetical protein